MAQKPFVHKDPNASDEALEKEAQDYLNGNRPLQVMVELTTKLRELDLKWWSPEKRREAMSATERMHALEQRPDIRQQIMVSLTGLPPKAARRLDTESQAKLIDDVLLEDRSVHEFETAYSPAALIIYGDPAAVFYQFIDALPRSKDSESDQKIMAAFIESCLNGTVEHDKKKLGPILSYWDVRTAIDYDTWQERIPRESRVAVDKARLELEKAKPSAAFSAKAEMEIVGVANLAKHIPMKQLVPVLEAAAKKMGFERPPPKTEDDSVDLEEGRSSLPPKS